MNETLTLDEEVFSAYAEVVPWTSSVQTFRNSILRVRGGSSLYYLEEIADGRYSPRTRR